MKEDFISKLKDLLINKKVYSEAFGTETISEVLDFAANNINGFDVKIKLDNDKSYFLYLALSKKGLIFDADTEAKLNDLKLDFDLIVKELDKAARAARAAAIKKEEEKRAAIKEEEKAKKAAIAREAKIRDAQQKARTLKNHHIVLTNDFYTTLGFIAKHVGVIRAQVPDFLEDWFRKTFPNQPYTFYDSTEKTSGGFSMKWNLSLTASLKNITDIPAGLTGYVNKNKITSTQFVYDLVDQFGFVFGKEQDLDKILATIPADKLDRFNEGFAA